MIHPLAPMRRFAPIALSCLVVAGIGAPATGEDAPEPAAITGLVVDPDGAPVVGARVWTRIKASRAEVEARTDADGRFRLGPIPPACPRDPLVFIEADGFPRQYARGAPFSLFPGVVDELGTIRLDHGPTATGQVLDPEGSPLAGATVEFRFSPQARGGAGVPGGPIGTTETDADGRFQSPPLPAGFFGAQVHVPGYKMGQAGTAISPGPGEIVLDPIRLRPDEPIAGIVNDADGRPVAGATVKTFGNYESIETDASGAFTLTGIASDRFPLSVSKPGYLRVSQMVTRSEEGLSWVERTLEGESRAVGPASALEATMIPVSWIEGRVVDAESGEPVRPSTIILCQVLREEDGTPVFANCHSSGFEQPEPGRVLMPYSVPGEYHLAVSADGYHDAEAFTPVVDSLRPIEGLSIAMRPRSAPPEPVIEDARLEGRVTRAGRPITSGWAAIGQLRRPDAVNASAQRGRTIAEPLGPIRGVPIRDGSFTLEVPNIRGVWHLLVDEPGHAPTIVGPIEFGLGERKAIEVEAAEDGSLSGRIAEGSEIEHLWVVAFNDLGFVAETRVGPDGTFAFRNLPPGRYGLKAGHDGLAHPEVVRVTSLGTVTEGWDAPADPWANAEVVAVGPGEAVTGVVVAGTSPAVGDSDDR